MNMKFKFTKRRAVSETIGTVLIMAITVVGAVFVANAMQGVLFPIGSSAATSEVLPETIQLMGYDTRDSLDLSNISDLDNQFNQLLCTTCATADVTPSEGGTEFIVLHFRNSGVTPVYFHNIMINNEGHAWDAVAAGNVLDPDHLGGTTGEFPADGKFSIVPMHNGTGPTLLQQATNELVGDGEVRVVIKLSGNIPQDIGMWDSMRILVNYGGTQPAEFMVLSGDAKW